MATYVSGPSGGNWTGGTTWCNVETGTNAFQPTRTATTVTSTAYVYTPNFTATNGDIIDGVMLYISQNIAGGTFSVELHDGTNSLRTVTVNQSDCSGGVGVGSSGGWMFFKFGSTYTATGLTTYKIGVKSSTNQAINLWTAGASGFSKIIRLTSNASPTTSDNLFITGEWTSAGASNSLTVTMDNTASTAWGKLDICSKGILNWGTSASTAYYLKTSGILEIWDKGKMQMGTLAIPVPTGSSNELEFVNAVNVDIGTEIRYGGTLTTYGYAKTLQALLLGPSFTITNKALTTNVVTLTTSAPHGLAVNDNVEIQMSPTDAVLDGTYVVTGTPLTTTFTYAKTASNIVSVAATGTVWKNVKVGATAGTLNTTPTGWKNGDIVTLGPSNVQGPSTTDTERLALGGDVSTTAITFAACAATHCAANLPWQADIINLTQNVRIHGTSLTLQAYVNVSDGGIINCFYTEFYFLGSATSLKRGINYGNTISSIATSSLNYCSFRDFAVTSSICVCITAGAVNFTTDNCVCYMNTSSGEVIDVSTTSTITSISITNSCFLSNNTQGYHVWVSSGQVTITNNTFAGSLRSINLTNGSNTSIVMGPVSNCRFKSTTNGVIIGVAGNIPAISLTITNCVFSRNIRALSPGSVCNGIVIDTCTFWSNSYAVPGYNGGSGAGISDIIFKSCTFDSGVNFTAAAAVDPAGGTIQNAIFSNCSFGVSYKHSTADINFSSTCTVNNVWFNNCLFNSNIPITAYTNYVPVSSAIGFMNFNQVAGDHRAYKRAGILKTDSVIYDSGISERMTPNTTIFKLESASKFVTIGSGLTRTISVKVRESVVGDGTAYNGSRIRLVARKNPQSIGTTADTVLATATASSTGAWEVISGTTPVAIADGQVECVVQCDGTTGWVNVDTWSAS